MAVTSGTWKFSDQSIGAQPIAATSATKQHTLGTIVSAVDTSATTDYGAGQFIYLLGVASTVIGNVVSYNATTYQTTLAPNTANLNTPVAVAMSANLAGSYGWYQISGLAAVLKTAVAVSPQVAIYLSGTAGKVKSTAASGKQIVNAKAANLATVASGTSGVTVLINRPHAQGAVL